jgi:protein Mpv17
MAIMEGGGVAGVKQKLDSTYKSALTKNWMLWPFVQTVNFKYVPLDQRVLVVNVLSIG